MSHELTDKEARKLAETRFGVREDVLLATSIDGSVTLAIGWFPHRRGRALYAVRVGYHFDGPLQGGFAGCYLHEDWVGAVESFQKAASALVRCCRPQTHGFRQWVSARCTAQKETPQ